MRAKIIRIMISLMQRVTDAGPGSISSLANLLVQANQDSGEAVSEDRRPYSSLSIDMLNPELLPADADVFAQLIAVAIRISATLSRLPTGATIPAEIKNYLVPSSDGRNNVFQLNQNVLGLVMNMLKVWAAYNEAIEQSA